MIPFLVVCGSQLACFTVVWAAHAVATFESSDLRGHSTDPCSSQLQTAHMSEFRDTCELHEPGTRVLHRSTTRDVATVEVWRSTLQPKSCCDKDPRCAPRRAPADPQRPCSPECCSCRTPQCPSSRPASVWRSSGGVPPVMCKNYRPEKKCQHIRIWRVDSVSQVTFALLWCWWKMFEKAAHDASDQNPQ